jgi:hypothetical protein
LGGAKDVKLLGREANFLDQYFVHSAKSARASQFQATLQMLPRLWLELLAVVGLSTLVISMLAQGREIATIVPTLGLFAAAAFRLMPSVNRVLAAAQVLRYYLPVVKPCTELKFAEPSGEPVHKAQLRPASSRTSASPTSTTATVGPGERAQRLRFASQGDLSATSVPAAQARARWSTILGCHRARQSLGRGGHPEQSSRLRMDRLCAVDLPDRRHAAAQCGLRANERSTTRPWRARSAPRSSRIRRRLGGLETGLGERGVAFGGQRQRTASHARCTTIRRCWCWTKPRARSIQRPKPV